MCEGVKEVLITKLNEKFSVSSERNRKRKIIFWYDALKDYEDLIDELELENTEIIKYDNNSIWIKYHIEKEEANKNIVIYLPFERFKMADNNLLDIETANSDLVLTINPTTMRLRDLGLENDCSNIVQKYSKFFSKQMQQNKFKDFEIENKTVDNIDYIVTSILLGIKTINEDEIIKNIIKVYYDDEKKYKALLKYGDEEFIVKLLNRYFGSNIESVQKLEDVFKSAVFTYFASSIEDIEKVGRYAKYLLRERMTNSQVFVNNLMRDKDTSHYFEIISNSITKEFGIKELLSTMEIDEYKNSDAFSIIDENIILYIISQLMDDISKFDSYNNLILLREKQYWYYKFYNEYNFLRIVNQYFETLKKVESLIKTLPIEDFANLYVEELYKIDTLYRKMYFYFDNIADKDNFMELKNKVENNYKNTYMMNLSSKWCDSIESLNRYDSNTLTMQNKFFDKYVKSFAESSKNIKTIVIISDAFRYESAKELNDKLKIFGTKSEIRYMLGLIPSYTRFRYGIIITK